MRVLNGRILVTVTAKTTDLLVPLDTVREGHVHVSATSQVREGERVLFGNDFEEVEIGPKTSTRYYLMDQDNVKIIYGGGPEENDKVLPFLKENRSA